MKSPRTVMLAVAAVCAAFLYGCDKDKDIIPGELTNDYWMETVTDGMMLRFDKTGDVFNYLYRLDAAEGMYYAYMDPAWSQTHKYLMDPDNGMLFFLPDNWYYILLLTSSGMILDDGENKHTFRKLPSGEVSIITKEEFDELFPPDND